jgi:cell division protein FtsN
VVAANGSGGGGQLVAVMAVVVVRVVGAMTLIRVNQQKPLPFVTCMQALILT